MKIQQAVLAFHCSSSSKFLLLVLLIFVAAVSQGWCFNYPNFPRGIERDLIITGEAYIVHDALQVTMDIGNTEQIKNRYGRIVHNNPIRLWKKGRLASFNSTFVLNVSPYSGPPGEGLAFILSQDSKVPNNSMGQWLGIVNATTNGTSQASIVAVEFDTKKSFAEDLDNNHVGFNINSINSKHQTSLNNSGLVISNGTSTNITAMIVYDGDTKTMNISVFRGKKVGTKAPILSIPNLDLSQYLPEMVYVGFSASTGPVAIERNCILEWYFTFDELGKESKFPRWVYIVVAVSILVSLCGIGVAAGYFCYKRKQRPLSSYDLPIFTGVGPKKFKLKDLKAATGNFNRKNELGRGGFGIVYKGNLEGQFVAVKRVKDTPKGMQNLIAEVTTIGSLHHKNLVELIGWCYEGSELLLVYEYMQHRSLDTFLYCNDEIIGWKIEDKTLSWTKRYNIICGVAQALDYLHNECLKRVLHRDIKASNIMLDAEFNARLGDFGLARMFKLSEKTHHSTKEIAGTPGYMAPELFLTGKATTETDVFAFGVLALVLATGKKPGIQDELSESSTCIIDWVWELNSLDSVTDAIDPKLKGSYDERQAKQMLVLGLACCHPNPNMRPSMGYVLQVLLGEAILPTVSSEKPAFVWPAPSPSFTNEHSYSGGMLSTFSSINGR
ncbi:probable L-type lectin-domain containing receptor kinase S.5 [Chenopodium quinoa]|uniref:non-specific serine/threonine protein kinase n=1 Tax=Chenopodium quinoa TaxID=63459 RepID=A0A803LM49_CHEQI|nr:probable L-type lectin-domain containing receptor kinase S.5 [Chenopodium quinoa]